jgi:putative nucleotidyltransferase with HDIG domain
MDDRRSQIWSVIKETRTLPTLPGVIVKLNALAGSDKATIQEMARLVTSDQVLSARVLRLVNSPSYGFYRVSTISNAMILLGVDVVKSLALSSSIFEIMEKSVVGLWEHSLGAGVAANVIARKLQLAEPEEISTAALLHDIGKIILKIKFDAETTQIYKLACTGERSLIEEEQDMLTTDHAEVGGWLARSWFLPDKLVEPISCHHEVAASDHHQVKTAVVHLADVLVKASGFGNSGDPFVPELQDAAWSRLGLNEQLLAEIVAEVEDKLLETKNFSLEVVGSGD